jgi:hypothetical protein
MTARRFNILMTSAVVATAIAIPLGPILAFELDQPAYAATVFLLAFFLV